MLKNLTVLLIFLFLFIASCSDDNVVNDSSVSFGEIFYHKYYNPNQSLIAATYKQNIPVGNGKLFCDTLKITSPSYGGKVAVAEEPSTSTYSRLFVMNTDGSNIIEIPQNNVYPNYYMLSPAADKVLFSTVAGHYLYIADADGTNLFMLAASISVYVPKFSPDGKYIAYVEFNPSRNLCIIKTDGTGKTIVKDSVESVVSLDWSPDGNKIIIQHHDINSTLYTINRDGSDYKFIAVGNEPSWSPDGTKICYSKNSDIFFMNADGGDQVNITNTNSEYENSPRWSPDSKAISYSTYDILKVSVCNIYKMETKVLADSASSAFWKYP